MTQVLLTTFISRLVCVGIVVYVTLLTRLSVSEAIGAVAVMAITAMVWWTGNRRTMYELEEIEENIGHRIGGHAQDVFIASRAGSYRYWPGFNYRLTVFESVAWVIIISTLLVVSVLINGLGSWHGLS